MIFQGFTGTTNNAAICAGSFKQKPKMKPGKKKSCEIIAAFTGSMYLKLKSQCFCVQELEFSQRFPTRLKLELQEFELFCNFQFLSFDALNFCSHTYLEVNNHMMTI